MPQLCVQTSAQPFQFLAPTGSITVHLAPRRTGGVLHWRFWDPLKANWRSGSTKTTARREAMTEAQKAIGKLLADKPDPRSAWTLGGATNDFLRDRFPEAATTAKGPSLADLPKHLDNQSPQYSTYRDIRQRLQRFAAHIGTQHPLGSADLFTGWCQQFLSARRAKGLSPTTLSNDQRVLSRLAAWIMSRRPARVDWPDNPARRKLLDLPPIIPQVPRIPPAANVERLLEHIRATDVYPAVLLILSGLRPSGAARITWEQIDLDQSTVQIPRAAVREKNMQRSLRLNRWAAGELRHWHTQAGSPTGRVWPYTSGYLFIRFRVLRTAAGTPGLTMQGLRRHVSQRLYAANVTPQIEAKIMGHSVATAMKHYVNLAQLDEHPDVEAALDFSRPAVDRSKHRSNKPKSKKHLRKNRPA
jgi:integrase